MPLTEHSKRYSVGSLIGPAEVLELDAAGENARVSRGNDWDCAEGWARVAVGSCPALQIGDQVIVAGELPDDLYVIGSLASKPPGKLTTSSGVSAECVMSACGQETLRVLSPRNEMLFEYDSATGTTRVAIPEGSLELSAGRGDLILRSTGTVRVQGEAIELHARSRLALSVSRSLAVVGTWLQMIPDRLNLGSDRVELSAKQGEAAVTRAKVLCDSVSTEANQYRLQAEKIETVAETVIERSGNVYQTVRDLVQTQTGRLRTYVAGLSHFRSRRAYFSSEESFNVDGEKINLG